MNSPNLVTQPDVEAGRDSAGYAAELVSAGATCVTDAVNDVESTLAPKHTESPNQQLHTENRDTEQLDASGDDGDSLATGVASWRCSISFSGLLDSLVAWCFVGC